MAKGKIQLGVSFNVDQSGLTNLKNTLSNLQNLTIKDIVGADSVTDAKNKLNQIKETAKTVETALQSSFNPTLNTYNIDLFKQKLQENIGSIQSLKVALSDAGASGSIAFRELTDALTSLKLPLQETHSLLKSMGTTLVNTIKWSIASTSINTITSSVQNAWGYVKRLDNSLNDIVIVTGKSSDEMERFAAQANQAAKALGATTTDYTKASLIYYRQGLSDEETAARAETTLKAANVTGQSTSAVSEQLTAIWNGYKVSAEEAEIYVDKLAAVAAATASDLEELSTGMSKVASAANIMGVDVDQLNAMLATTISVTRQAPETVGTAFKTIFARISDIEAGIDEDVTLGEYTQQMANLGINVLDSNNQLRDQGEVIEEIGNKWDSLTREQQVALSQVMAGTRQYNNLMALFDNWDMYQESLQISADSMGTLQEQQEAYLESIEAHLNKLETSGQRVYAALFDTKDAANLLDILTSIVDVMGNWVEALGGGGNLLLMIVPLMTHLFAGNIAKGISTFVTNLNSVNVEGALLKTTLDNINTALDSGDLEEYDKAVLQLRAHLVELRQAGLLTAEQYNELQEQIKGNVAQINKYEKERDKEESLQSRLSNFGIGLKNEDGSDKLKTIRDYGKRKAADQGGLSADEALKRIKTLGALEGNEDEGAAAAYDELKIKLTAISEEFKIAKKEAQDFNKTVRTLGSKTEENRGKDIEALKPQVQGLKNKAAVIGKKGLSEDESKSLDIALENVENYINRTEALRDEDIKNLQQNMAEVQRLINKGSDNVINEANSFQKEIDNTVRGTAERTKSSVEEGANSIKDKLSALQLEERIKQITEFASNMAMAASALQLFLSVGSIWDNEDLSTGEKILQTIQSYGSALMMLMPTLKSVIALSAKHKKATDAETAANVKNAASQALKYWQLMLIAAAVAAVIAAVVILAKREDEETKAANRAAEQAQKLSEAYTNVKNAYEELKESISDYKEAEDAIDELVAGTEEWQEAVNDLNEQVMELIEKYPQLAQYVTNENGKLSISQEGLNELQTQQQAAVQESYRTKLIAQIDSYDKENEKLLNDFSKKLEVRNLSDNFSMTSATKTQVEEFLSILEKHPEYATQEEKDSGYESLQKALSESTDASLRETAGLENFASYVDSAIEASDDLSDKLAENSQVTEALRQQYALSLLQGNNIYSDLQNKLTELEEKYKEGEIDKATYQTQSQNIQEQMSALTNYVGSDGFISKKQSEILDTIEAEASQGKEARKELAKEYWAQQWGIDESQIEVSFAGGDSYTVKNKYNSEQKESGQDYKELYELLAKQRAGDQDSLSETEVKDFLNTFNQLSEEQKKAYSSFVGGNSGNFSKLSNSEIKDLKSKWKDASYDSLGDDELNELRQIAIGLGLETSEEALKTLLENFQTGLNNYDSQESTDSTISNLFNNWNTISGENKKELYNLWKEVSSNYNKAGQDAVEALYKAFDGNETVLLDGLTDVNWAEEESVETFLEVLGAIVGENNEALNNFVKMMRTDNTVFDLEKATESWSNFTKAVNSAATNNKVSADEYASLYETLGDDADNYFVRMADGTYALTKAGNEFKKVADKIALDKKIEAYKEAQAEYEAEKSKVFTEDDLSDPQKAEFLEQSGWDGKSYSSTYNESIASNAQNTYDAFNQDEYEISDDYFTGGQFVFWKSGQKNKYEDGDSKVSINADKWLELVSLIEQYDSSGKYSSKIEEWRTALNKAKVGSQGLFGASNRLHYIKSSILKEIESAADFLKNNAKSTVDEQTKLKNSEEGRQNYNNLVETAVTNENSAQNSKVEELKENLNTQFQDLLGSSVYSVETLNYIAKELGLIDENGNFIGTDAEKEVYLNYKAAANIEMSSIEAEIDPLEKTNKLLKAREKILSDLQKEQEKVYGQGVLNNLKKQREAIEEINGVLLDQVDIAENEISNTRTDIIEALTEAVGLDYSVVGDDIIAKVFAENGLDFDNLDKETALRIYEDYVTSNGGSQEDIDAFEALWDSLDDWENELEDRNEQLEEYQETLHDIAIQEFDYKIELKLDTQSALRDYNDFIRSIYEDDASTVLSSYDSDAVSYYKDIQTAVEAIRDIQDSAEMTEAEKVEYLKQQQDILQDSLLGLVESREEYEQMIVDAVTDITEAYDEQKSTLENINALLENERALIELTYGDKASTMLGSYFQLKKENTENSLKLARAEYQAAKAALGTIIDTDSEAYKQAYDTYVSAGQGLSDAVLENAQTFQEAWANTIENIFKSEGALDIDALQEAWDWTKETTSGYYDTIEKGLALEKLELTYREKIAGTTDPRIQQKYNDLLKSEVETLKEIDKLSEADVERAEKKLSLLEAQIALEEARSSKNSLQLMRGADGTYSYQYVADDTEVLKAQQAVIEAKQDMYNSDKKALETSQEEWLTLYKDYQDYFNKAAADGLDEKELEKLEEYADRLKDGQGEIEKRQSNIAEDLRELGYSEDEITEASTNSTATNILDYNVDDFLKKIQSGEFSTGDYQAGVSVGEQDQEMLDEYRQSQINKYLDEDGNFTTAGVEAFLTQIEDIQSAISRLFDSEKFKQYQNSVVGIITDIKNLLAEANEIEEEATDEEITIDFSSIDTDTVNTSIAEGAASATSTAEKAIENSQGIEKENTGSAAASSSNSTVSQLITINAEFPNVQDCEQIKIAFNEMENLAVQHAYEDNKL